MDFTYKAYSNLIALLRKKGYFFAGYHDWGSYDRVVILRHDIDYDMGKAVEMARLEQALGVKSTYFVLLTGDFYNCFAKEARRKLLDIRRMEHNIGLHFDELCYTRDADMVQMVEHELELLSGILGEKVLAVSMHWPSESALQADWRICGGMVVNSYGHQLFREFKYLSDSHRHWREDVEDIIGLGEYPRIQILTHAFWYYEEERGLEETMKSFIHKGMLDRYDKLDRNFKDLGAVVARETLSPKPFDRRGRE